MRTFLLLLLLCGPAYAQTDEQPNRFNDPGYVITILIDGKPLTDYNQGVPRTASKIAIRAALNESARKKFPDLKPEMVVRQASVSLARGDRRLAVVYFTEADKEVELNFSAQEDDRLVISVDDLVARRQDGSERKMATISVYNLNIN